MFVIYESFCILQRLHSDLRHFSEFNWINLNKVLQTPDFYCPWTYLSSPSAEATTVHDFEVVKWHCSSHVPGLSSPSALVTTGPCLRCGKIVSRCLKLLSAHTYWSEASIKIALKCKKNHQFCGGNVHTDMDLNHPIHPDPITVTEQKINLKRLIFLLDLNFLIKKKEKKRNCPLFKIFVLNASNASDQRYALHFTYFILIGLASSLSNREKKNSTVSENSSLIFIYKKRKKHF